MRSNSGRITVGVVDANDRSLPVLGRIHNDLCVAITAHYAPEVQVAGIDVLGGNADLSARVLAKEIADAASAGMNVINVSAGTLSLFGAAEIQKACDQAVEHGSIVVAAGDQRRRWSAPAALANVIGVISSFPLFDPGARSTSDADGEGATPAPAEGLIHFVGSPVEFACPGGIPAPIAAQYDVPNKIGLDASSFAAPRLSAEVAAILAQGEYRSVKEIRDVLVRSALSVRTRSSAIPVLDRVRGKSSPPLEGNTEDESCIYTMDASLRLLGRAKLGALCLGDVERREAVLPRLSDVFAGSKTVAFLDLDDVFSREETKRYDSLDPYEKNQCLAHLIIEALQAHTEARRLVVVTRSVEKIIPIGAHLKRVVLWQGDSGDRDSAAGSRLTYLSTVLARLRAHFPTAGIMPALETQAEKGYSKIADDLVVVDVPDVVADHTADFLRGLISDNDKT